MTILLENCYRPIEGLEVKDTGDQVLIGLSDHDETLCLNQTAAIVWRLCDGTRTGVEIVDLLVQAYPEADPEIQSQVMAALSSFVTRGVVESSNSCIDLCPSKKKVILFHNSMWNAPFDYPETDVPADYEISTDRRLLSDAVAVVFHLPSLPLTTSLRKRPGQLWVAWSMECQANYPSLERREGSLRFFDLTMTYHLDADVSVPYVNPEFQTTLRKPVRVKTSDKRVNAFISSKVDASGRLAYLRELMRHIEVHSYGKMLNNKSMATDGGRHSKLETLGQYQFSLAFENAVARDYVTEKFFDPLLAGSVPVYLGAPNIEDFAPGDHCFVNAADFADPRALADYLLEVSMDEQAYSRYFAWKEQPFRPNFVRLLEQQQEHPFVRLCKIIEERLSCAAVSPVHS
jgi:Glycosyltransferase family 10 (fucosyltransferase) C-term/Fucosyltransferase, N-terminal/Coenzyme PQQ synthesis protein D (PqqD)